VTDLLPLLQEFYREKLTMLQQHEAGARLVGQYDANNTYQYVINRDDVQLSWLSKAIVELGGAEPAPAAEPAPTSAPSPTATGDVASAKGEVRVQELTRTQQVIARRMAEAKATVPEFTLEAEIDMDAAVRARAELKAMASQDAVVPSYNDMIVKASALALREFPRANGAYRDGHWELYSRVNVGVAVAGQDSLVVPVVFDADSKALGEIARETRARSIAPAPRESEASCQSWTPRSRRVGCGS